MKNTKKNKRIFLEQLAKSAILQIACEKTGIGKSTIYRWREADKEFDAAIDTAMTEGKSLVTDLAESQLISAIKDRNMTAIKLWLEKHHPEYKNTLEITANIKKDTLTPEEYDLVQKALALSALIPPIIMPKNIQPAVIPKEVSDKTNA